MLINIRGAFGSGKTTAAKRALGISQKGEEVILHHASRFKPIKSAPDRWIETPMKGTLSVDGKTVALGSYQNNCGGTDNFSWKGAHDDIERAIKNAATQYEHVIYEGVVVAGLYQRYVDLAEAMYEQHGPTHVVFLMPSVEECLRRVVGRTGRPIEDKNTKSVNDKWRAVDRCYDRMKELNAKYIRPEYFTDTDEGIVRILELLETGK